jgi:hypothetical protein
VVSSGGLASVQRDQARGLNFVRRSHRDVARETTNTSRAARGMVRRSGAAVQLQQALLDDSMPGDDHKRHLGAPHLLA